MINSSQPSEITVLENYGILIKNVIKPLTLLNSCGYGPKTLKGSFFITFSNCSINIGDSRFDSKIFKFVAKPDIIPLHFVEVNETFVHTNKVEEMHELQTNNRHRINHLESSNLQSRSFHLGSVAVISIIVMSIFIYVIRELRGIRAFIHIQAPNAA